MKIQAFIPSRILYALLLFLLVLSTGEIFAQFVRREHYPTERERRGHYALDDWISYLKTRHFTSVVMGTHYIYFGTADGGILRYHFYDNFWDYPFTTSNGLPSNKIFKLAYDRRTSFLWAKTDKGLAVFDPAAEEWKQQRDYPHLRYDFSKIPEMGTNTNGDTIIPEGVFYPREALKHLPTFFANRPYTIIDEWILMDDHFQEFPITGYLRDRYDRIWFVVEGFGYGVGDSYSQRADFYEVGLPDISPRAIAYQDDDIWIGGIGRRGRERAGIALWPADEPGWHYFEARWISHLPADDVNDILVDGDSVWFATTYGVSLYNRDKQEWSNFHLGHGLTSNQVLDLARLGDYLYLATDQGISRINRLTGDVQKIKEPRLVNLRVRKLSAMGDSLLWAATYRGIYRFNVRKNEWEFVSSRAAINDFDVTAVAAFEDEVWFATSSGIMMLNLTTQEWLSFPQIGMEIRGPFRDIVVNDASVWVATPEGLLKFDREKHGWRIFTEEDGLLDNRCYQLMLDGDFIWIVTATGITQFYWNSPQRSD